MAWPGLNYAAYKRSYNLDTGAFGDEFARSRSEPNGGEGGLLPQRIRQMQGGFPVLDLKVTRVANVERLGLAPERILPLHSRLVPYTELLAQVGRR